MRKLRKHDLNLNPSLAFFKESLEETNSLSVEIIKFIECEKGTFFTLLPEEANLEKLHQFELSVLPELPRQKGPIGSLQGVHTYSKVPSLEEEYCEYLTEEIRRHKYTCIIDDFNQTYNEQYHCDLFDKFGKHHKEEVYYFIDPSNLSQENILACLYRSKTFWHSLCILTEVKINVEKKTLSKEEIQKICTKARYVMIGAYDGEGYIFWEKAKA
jgi:hypothetical protein